MKRTITTLFLTLAFATTLFAQVQEGLIVGLSSQQGDVVKNSLLPLTADGQSMTEPFDLGKAGVSDILALPSASGGGFVLKLYTSPNNVRLGMLTNKFGERHLITASFPAPWPARMAMLNSSTLLLSEGFSFNTIQLRSRQALGAIVVPWQDELLLPGKGVASLMTSDPQTGQVYFTLDELNGRSLWGYDGNTFRQILPTSRNLLSIVRMTVDDVGNLYCLLQPLTGLGLPSNANYSIWRLTAGTGSRQVIETSLPCTWSLPYAPFAVSGDGRYAFIADKANPSQPQRIMRFDLSAWEGGALSAETVYTFQWGYPSPLEGVTALAWGKW